MNETIRLENKKEDKKHLGKFLLMLVGGFLIGIVMGIIIAVAEDVQSLPTTISRTVYHLAASAAPYVGVVYSVAMVIMLIIVKSKAGR